MVFRHRQKVMFKHCDPAGIVFFPRYFEMMNDVVELYFDKGLGMPFEVLHRTSTVPTARIDTRFAKPSRHGDQLDIALWITEIGRTSGTYRMTAECNAELRFDTTATLVHVDLDGRPAPWPDPLKTKLTEYAVQHEA